MLRMKLNWGILGTGAIAKSFARGLATSKYGRLVAVGSRTKESAERFGSEFNIPHRHASYEAMLADREVDAVYIATPHPMHPQWAIKAAEAKKHVLVEKPIAMNFHDACAIIEAARENDVFLMEAFMYRCHPQMARLSELIREKAIGDVLVIHATFAARASVDETSRLLANEMGGGAIMDIGCYPVSISRFIAGAAQGQPFVEPIEVKGTAHLGSTGVDEYAVASLRFPGDILAQLTTGVRVNVDSVVRIFGTEGNILIPSPWIPYDPIQRLIVQRTGEEPREVIIDSPMDLYAREADVVAQHIDQRQAPQMSWDDTLGNIRTLDAWRKSIGLTYEFEKSAGASAMTVARRKLAVRPKHNMKYGRIDGIDKPVSRLIMGVDNQEHWPHAAVMFDDYFERGGNTFDTAHIYASGAQEMLLGQWLAKRGVRDSAVVIAKGAHTPWCDPENLTRQLLESLDRLGASADIYLMHRDNLQIPVGEFVDVLNEHVRAGRMRIFGGSNWSTQRIDEANDYARRKNLKGFAAVSNNFSLARLIQPVWPGCISASDPQSRQWFERTQTPLLAWSSQARGFFVSAAPDKLDDPALVHCWYSEDNFQRLERVNELAKKRNVLPINIALAYVLNQPFPTFPLIGPRTLRELHTSLPALDVELSPQELRWLNLEE